MQKVALHNLGCKVNSYEMDVISQKLVEKGYVLVPFEEMADIYYQYLYGNKYCRSQKQTNAASSQKAQSTGDSSGSGLLCADGHGAGA